MAILFKSSRSLQAAVDEYLDSVSQGVMVFNMGVGNYLAKKEKKFLENLEAVDKLESKADRLRRLVENDLYSHSLIPEHRGDVLGLLESIDNIADDSKEILNQFDVEQPHIPDEVRDDFQELSEKAMEAAEHVVKASRAFFKDVRLVQDHLHKVYFFEKECDKIGYSLKRKAFRLEKLDLSQKMHIRYFALHIDNLADEAEHVADRLSIYTIKRSM